MEILCGADTSFPLNLRDLLLCQVEHTLNMSRPSRMTPTVSSYTYLWGQHDYNANPFAPLGCKIKSYLVPGIRETWAPHTASGYYVWTSWKHYRCHVVYIIDTRHTRMCSSVFFKHKYLTMPSLTPAVALIRAADYLTTALAGVIPPPSITTNTSATHQNPPMPLRNSSKSSRCKPRMRRTRQHFKGCYGKMHKLKGCSLRPWHHLQVQPMNLWLDPPLPRKLIRPHIHHSRSKNTPKWM